MSRSNESTITSASSAKTPTQHKKSFNSVNTKVAGRIGRTNAYLDHFQGRSHHVHGIASRVFQRLGDVMVVALRHDAEQRLLRETIEYCEIQTGKENCKNEVPYANSSVQVPAGFRRNISFSCLSPQSHDRDIGQVARTRFCFQLESLNEAEILFQINSSIVVGVELSVQIIQPLKKEATCPTKHRKNIAMRICT